MRNPYCNRFDCKKALEIVMCTDIGCRLGTTIVSLAGINRYLLEHGVIDDGHIFTCD